MFCIECYYKTVLADSEKALTMLDEKTTRSDVEQEIKKELGLPEWLLLMPFLEEILEQAKAWQSLTTIIPTEDKKLPYLIQANRLARK